MGEWEQTMDDPSTKALFQGSAVTQSSSAGGDMLALLRPDVDAQQAAIRGAVEPARDGLSPDLWGGEWW